MSNIYRLSYVFLFAIILVTGCIPEEEVIYDGVDINLKNTDYQKTMDLVIDRKLDSLLQLTSSPDPTKRYILATAMASMQESKSLDSLYKLLDDEEQEISAAAAYAIGQIKDPIAIRPLMNAFKAVDSSRLYNEHNASILEAVGKLSDSTLLNAIATVKSYKANDTLLLLGQARALYQYTLRGKTSSTVTNAVIDNVLNKTLPEKARNIAAHTLYRIKDIDITPYEQRLFRLFDNEKNPHIKMALALTLGSLKDRELINNFVGKIKTEPDYRVKINMIKALDEFPYIRVIEPVLELLKDPNIQVAQTAGDYLIRNGIAQDAPIYKNFIPSGAHYSVKNKVNAAILYHLPKYYKRTKETIKRSLLQKYNESSDPYEKANILYTLSYDVSNYKDLINHASMDSTPVERSSSAMGLKHIVESDNFSKYYGRNADKVKTEIIDSARALLQKADVGVGAILGDMISNKDNGFKSIIKDPSFIKTAMDKLPIPEAVETYNSLNKAYSYLVDSEYKPKEIVNSKKIDWRLLSSYGDTIMAMINTDKGTIELKLYPKMAPQTVTNFIELANSEFYDSKHIHRVAPNFVIQDGCPRGDGYGSLDYAIRSEYSQLYYEGEGYIGMASAGPDTEGTQWFITHSPTMHLNGRYTIFGKVIKGMSTVHDLQVGDKINDITIIKQ